MVNLVTSFMRQTLATSQSRNSTTNPATETAAEISFDAEAIASAKTLLDNPNNHKDLKDSLIEKLTGLSTPRSFSSKEGEFAADIVHDILPSFFDNPTEFSNALLDGINTNTSRFLNHVNKAHLNNRWEALLEDKSALKDVLNVIDQALIESEGGTSNVLLLQPLIDRIGDEPTEVPPELVRQSTNAKRTLLQKTGSALKNPLLIGGLALGAIGLEATGIINVIPNAPLGTTTPPAQVVGGGVMKAITNFPGKNLSTETQPIIQARIDQNLNNVRERLPGFTMTPTAYYGDTLKPLTPANKALGVKVQADVKNNPTDTGDGQPSVIFYQQGITSVHITVIPVNEARAESLRQNGNNFTLIQIPVGKTPIVETKQGDLSSLLN
jgi:hypothetical protein